MKNYHVYILRGSDGTLYTGITPDLEKRLLKHNGALPGGAKYTKTRRPWALAYSEECGSRSEALKREYEIKRMTRERKDEIIASCHKQKSSRSSSE